MPSESARKRRTAFYRTFALAMELPIILVVAPVIGFLLGYWLDKRLKTSPLLALLLGVIGFAGGVREVLRRIPKNDKGEKSGGGDAEDTGAAGEGDDRG